MTAPELVAEVRATVIGDRFLELARDLGGKPKRAGADWRCACFLHGGSSPNLVLTPTTGLWHCMSTCGGGDVFDLVRRARSVDFPAALAWLAEWAGLTRVFPKRKKLWDFSGEACPPAPDFDFKGRGGVDRIDGHPRASLADAREGVRSGVAAPTTSEGASATNGAFLAALWCRVAESCWTAPVADWLAEARGIEPDTAYALGCRDWSTARREIAELIDATPTDVLEAVGLGRDGRLHPAVSGCLRGDPEWAAVAVPIWRLGRAYPERWRFRLVTPRRSQNSGVLKSIAGYAAGLAVDLLGVGRPARLDVPEVRLAWLGSGAPGSELVIIAEGEPDLWSATEVVDRRAVVVGVCGSPTRWREGWPSMHDLAALGVRRVAVCVHHGARSKGRDGRELGHGERFAEVVAGECARAGLAFTRKLAGEGADLNDLHRAGRLHGFLADVLEG